MTAQELYDLLDEAGIAYEVVEIFEGARCIRVVVDEVTDEGDLTC
jgi:hypothetical protein